MFHISPGDKCWKKYNYIYLVSFYHGLIIIYKVKIKLWLEVTSVLDGMNLVNKEDPKDRKSILAAQLVPLLVILSSNNKASIPGINVIANGISNP